MEKYTVENSGSFGHHSSPFRLSLLKISSYQILGFGWPDRLWLVYGQPLHEPGEFFTGEAACLLRLAGPLVASAVQALVQ